MTARHEDDAAAIRAQIDGIAAAIRARDLDAFREIYATDVVSFDIEPPMQHVGIDAKLQNWARVFAMFAEVDYEIRDLTLAVDEHVAFAHGFGRLRGTLRDGTATSGMWVRATYGLRRADGRWQVAHDQVSVPLRMPGGTGATDLEP